MELPALTLPKVELPFDIPVLLHPAVDHFMIALPVVILLLELINLIMKKKAIGGISFFLIFLTIFIAAGAYLTGLVDGKEAYPALSESAKTALSEHKLLGTYLLLASVVVFFFKFLSAVTGKGILKLLYLLVLIVFVAGIFKQGQEGGELVYKFGMNVEQVKTLDDELFDLKEELEELTPKVEKSEPVTTPVETEISEVKTAPVIPDVQIPEATMPEVPAVETPKEATPEVPTVKILEDTAPVESVRTDMKEAVVPAVKEAVETLQVEGMPEDVVQPEIATH